MSHAACSTCTHGVTGLAPDKSLIVECRRFPPTLAIIASPQGLVNIVAFPQVKGDAYCGEHSVKAAIRLS